MKIMDLAPTDTQNDFVNKLSQQLQNLLGTRTEAQAQNTLLATLSRILPNNYIAVRNFKIEDLVVPVVLVGPTGLRVFYASPLKGIFRAKDEEFSAVKGKDFSPVRPNPIQRTLFMTHAVEKFLKDKSCPVPDETQAILFFSEPGVHINTTRPAARIVLVDGLERFASNIAAGNPTLGREAMQSLINALNPPQEEEVAAPVIEEAPKTEEGPKPVNPVREREAELTRKLTKASNKVKFKTWQWIVLGVMMAVAISVLMGGIIYLIYLANQI